MLALPIPDAGDGDEGWRNSTFCKSEKETNSCEAGEVVWDSKAHAKDAPEYATFVALK
jgi:hypothetical protein